MSLHNSDNIKEFIREFIKELVESNKSYKNNIHDNNILSKPLIHEIKHKSSSYEFIERNNNIELQNKNSFIKQYEKNIKNLSYIKLPNVIEIDNDKIMDRYFKNIFIKDYDLDFSDCINLYLLNTKIDTNGISNRFSLYIPFNNTFYINKDVINGTNLNIYLEVKINIVDLIKDWYKIIFVIFGYINSLQINGNMIIFFPSNNNNEYIHFLSLLRIIFKKVTLIFPTELQAHRNRIFILLKNKLSNIEYNKNSNLELVTHNSDTFYEDIAQFIDNIYNMTYNTLKYRLELYKKDKNKNIS